MAITLEGIDTERLVTDPRAMDEHNQSVIKEFRANQGKVGGPMEGMPDLAGDHDRRQNRPNSGTSVVLFPRR